MAVVQLRILRNLGIELGHISHKNRSDIFHKETEHDKSGEHFKGACHLFTLSYLTFFSGILQLFTGRLLRFFPAGPILGEELEIIL